MKKSSNFITLVFAIALFYVICSCGSEAGYNDPGKEYMPDMGHSIAYEANYYDYYSKNTWGSEQEYYEMAKPRKPVAGTIPRGYAGEAASDNPNALKVPANGSVPYYYADTEEERTRAMNEITTNPFPITEEGLARAKPLYEVNCGICHGNKGDGNGWLVDEKNKNAKYPAQPAILTNDEFTGASEGRFYHAIMHGKNVMGGYADKLSYEERWQVIHYIRSLQAKDRKLAYNEQSNTLNASAIPGASLPKKVMTTAKVKVPMLAHGHNHDEHHGDSHQGHDSHHSGDHDDANTHGHEHDAEHHGDGHSHHKEGESHDHDDHNHKDDHH